MSIREQGYLEDIVAKIRERRVVLFLGAGCSMTCGGPSAEQLISEIKQKFPRIDQNLTDFSDVCQDVIDTIPYNRSELEEFIIHRLDRLSPSQSHIALSRYDWAAIFTTNYDDLIEMAYHTDARLKPCRSVIEAEPSINITRRDRVYLFKLMGCIRHSQNDFGGLVLTRSDMRRNYKKRETYLKQLFDIMKDGTILYIGYSFNDRLALDIMHDVVEIHGDERVPWSYALFPHVLDNEKAKNKLERMKIIPVELDFDGLFAYLEERLQPPEIKPSPEIVLRLRGADVIISDDEFREFSEYFEVINEKSVKESAGKIADFFKGINRSWGIFREKKDFIRESYHDSSQEREQDHDRSLRKRVFSSLETGKSADIFLIKGIAGIGKTTMLRRIAFDAYTEGYPVIILNSNISDFDYKLFQGFISCVERRFESINDKKRLKTPRTLIVVDDAASLIRDVKQIKNWLDSMGKPALIIAAERVNDWEIANERYPYFNLSRNNIFPINERVSSTEREEMINYLEELGYVHSRDRARGLIKEEYKDSFFATIYSLIVHSREPLNKVISNQYSRLKGIPKKAFEFICIFNQFGLPINYELLVRALEISYSEFAGIRDKELSGIIFEEEDRRGYLYYRTHHRIIAEKTVELCIYDPEMQKELLVEILSKTNLSSYFEREVCEKLLIKCIGPGGIRSPKNRRNRLFTWDQLREMFRAACSQKKTRSLAHHWGILEMETRNFESAERLLLEALNLPRFAYGFYRNESEQNIQTSLGVLYSLMGLEQLKEGNEPIAESHFQKALSRFRIGQIGEFPNVYAYHAEANMCYQKGIIALEKEKKIGSFVDALKVLNYAIDNLNKDELILIHELKARIYRELGDEYALRKCVSLFRDRYKSSKGYYLLASYYFYNAMVFEAHETIEEALEHFSTDEHCLAMKSKLHKKLKPYDQKGYFDILKRWEQNSSMPNLHLLFELAVTSFALGYYQYSYDYFDKLGNLSVGHSERSKPTRIMWDENGKKWQHEGIIYNLEGWNLGTIRCSTLRNLEREIPFIPRACHFTPKKGDYVNFKIGFSFRGPIALEVRKIP